MNETRRRPQADSLSSPAAEPSMRVLGGRYASLEPLRRDHIDSLWHSLGGSEASGVFEFVTGQAPADPDTLWQLFKDEKFSFAIVPRLVEAGQHRSEHGESAIASALETTENVAGVIVYSPVHLEHRALEIGALYSPSLQRTPTATEAHFLALQHVLEQAEDSDAPPFRRVVWKCNAVNEKSMRAAARMGYQLDGIFRKHMIERGRSRDTAWFSLIDDDWPRVRGALTAWLHPGNFDHAGKQRRKLEDIRLALNTTS